ncbi:2-(1,2-epoxy-1,2-dihydrophenyl)acetyl-CoA isomerase [Burkholderiales bacterium]|nr:2-(1,2-epoxy-1,2-dihydrophenyl)acetyl-CoA isomerase [Burkholderiales bacterium]
MMAPTVATAEGGRESAHIVVSVADGVLDIEMRRPEKKNALTVAMYEGLTSALEEAERRSEVRAVLLHGQPNVFTSGNDLQDFLRQPALDDGHPAFRFVRTISSASKPIVAAVNGACIGVGATMLLHCDLVYAGQGAVFALPFVNLGLCPEAGSSVLVPRMVGHARAAELLLLGEPFDAATAASCGIVGAVLSDGDVLAHAAAQARKLATKPPVAVRVSKALMRRAFRAEVEDAIRTESAEFRARLASAEAKEAFAAFLEKRKADFSHFN